MPELPASPSHLVTEMCSLLKAGDLIGNFPAVSSQVEALIQRYASPEQAASLVEHWRSQQERLQAALAGAEFSQAMAFYHKTLTRWKLPGLGVFLESAHPQKVLIEHLYTAGFFDPYESDPARKKRPLAPPALAPDSPPNPDEVIKALDRLLGHPK